jgi:prepilin-type N-terminal cleavage/methylation domain-containing protein
MMMKLFRNEGGFTLIEILIVVLIIGIIAALAIPNLMAARQASWGSTCAANRSSIASAVELYRIHNDGTLSTGFVIGDLLKGVKNAAGFTFQPALTAIPNCPETGTSTVYSVTVDSGGNFTVACANQVAKTHP